MRFKQIPALDILNSLFTYDQSSGILRWRSNRVPTIKAGDPAGSRTRSGHLTVGINGGDYFVHRVIWKMVTGRDPCGEIDHKDTDGLNNRFDNLREASSSNNKMNVRRRADNKSGHKGVHFYKRDLKWHAQITVNRRNIHLGYFELKEDACAAYRAACELHFGEFGRVA